MDQKEIQEVLANWIAQATAPPPLPEGINPAQWIAEKFLRWWRQQIDDDLTSAESAVQCAWQELEKLGGWSHSQIGEALHELVHAREALSALRTDFDFDRDESLRHSKDAN